MGDLTAIALFGNQNLTNLTLLLYSQISAYRLDSASGTALVLLALCLASFAALERGIGGRSRTHGLS
jgi:thiamine transport system permease protein